MVRPGQAAHAGRHGAAAGGLRFERFYERPGMAGELPIAIGASRFGPLWADLAALPHLLVGGLTGGGKSAFLRQLVVGLVLRLQTQGLRLVVLDLKGMEFGLLERLPHLMAPVARDLDAALDVLSIANGELDRRQALFAGAGVETLGGWNRARPGEPLPHVLVVVDECAELSAAEGAAGGGYELGFFGRTGADPKGSSWSPHSRRGRAHSGELG